MKQNTKSPAPLAIIEEKVSVENILQSIKNQKQKIKEEQLALIQDLQSLQQQLRDFNQIIPSNLNSEKPRLTQELIKQIQADQYCQLRLEQIQTQNNQLFQNIIELEGELPNYYQRIAALEKNINLYKSVFRIRLKELSNNEITIIFYKQFGESLVGQPLDINLKVNKTNLREQFWKQYEQQ